MGKESRLYRAVLPHTYYNCCCSCASCEHQRNEARNRAARHYFLVALECDTGVSWYAIFNPMVYFQISLTVNIVSSDSCGYFMPLLLPSPFQPGQDEAETRMEAYRYVLQTTQITHGGERQKKQHCSRSTLYHFIANTVFAEI